MGLFLSGLHDKEEAIIWISSCCSKEKMEFQSVIRDSYFGGGFFLFNFLCKEDFDLVNDHEPCFLNGRSFLFQKWSWNFKPTKEDVREIPLWINLSNFPLCYWNESRICKAASRILCWLSIL